MPESLMVIRSFSTLRKHWEWMTFSADSVSSVHTLTDDLPLGSLADQPGAGNVHLLIPPEGLLYRSLTLPNAKYKLTAQTLQWLAEETLPDASQNWHWTVVDKQNESVEVIGIQSEKLSRYLERLHTAGLNVTRVLPDGCYLPWEVDSWTLVNQQTSWLIRSAAHAFNELDEHWLQHLANQFPPENMRCYGVAPHGVAAANPLIQHPEIPSLSLYSADIAFQRYDMLHGVFRKQKTVGKSGKWLTRLAVSCLVLAILSFVGAGASRSGKRLRLKINFSNNSKKPGNVISRRSNTPTTFVFTLSSNSLSNILKLYRCSIIYKHFCLNTLNCS